MTYGKDGSENGDDLVRVLFPQLVKARPCVVHARRKRPVQDLLCCYDGTNQAGRGALSRDLSKAQIS